MYMSRYQRKMEGVQLITEDRRPTRQPGTGGRMGLGGGGGWG